MKLDSEVRADLLLSSISNACTAEESNWITMIIQLLDSAIGKVSKPALYNKVMLRLDQPQICTPYIFTHPFFWSKEKIPSRTFHVDPSSLRQGGHFDMLIKFVKSTWDITSKISMILSCVWNTRLNDFTDNELKKFTEETILNCKLEELIEAARAIILWFFRAVSKAKRKGLRRVLFNIILTRAMIEEMALDLYTMKTYLSDEHFHALISTMERLSKAEESCIFLGLKRKENNLNPWSPFHMIGGANTTTRVLQTLLAALCILVNDITNSDNNIFFKKMPGGKNITPLKFYYSSSNPTLNQVTDIIMFVKNIVNKCLLEKRKESKQLCNPVPRKLSNSKGVPLHGVIDGKKLGGLPNWNFDIDIILKIIDNCKGKKTMLRLMKSTPFRHGLLMCMHVYQIGLPGLAFSSSTLGSTGSFTKNYAVFLTRPPSKRFDSCMVPKILDAIYPNLHSSFYVDEVSPEVNGLRFLDQVVHAAWSGTFKECGTVAINLATFCDVINKRIQYLRENSMNNQKEYICAAEMSLVKNILGTIKDHDPSKCVISFDQRELDLVDTKQKDGDTSVSQKIKTWSNLRTIFSNFYDNSRKRSTDRLQCKPVTYSGLSYNDLIIKHSRFIDLDDTSVNLLVTKFIDSKQSLDKSVIKRIKGDCKLMKDVARNVWEIISQEESSMHVDVTLSDECPSPLVEPTHTAI